MRWITLQKLTMSQVIEILGELVAADEAAGEPHVFVLVYTMSDHAEFVGHPGWPDDAPVPSSLVVDDLADRGWVRISESEGMRRTFGVTEAGRAAHASWSARRAVAPTEGVDLGWTRVRSVLHEVYEVYIRSGAPETGIETDTLIEGAEDSAGTAAAIRELVRAGFLEPVFGLQSAHAPRLVRPTTLALQVEAGWPADAAQAALSGLVAAIDEELNHTTDLERRSRLMRVRDGLLGAARDVALAYFEKKVVGL